MQIDLRNVRTRWINVDKDEEKALQMNALLDGYEFTDHTRVSAVTGIEPHEGVRPGEEHYRNCAESHFKILEETILADGEPVLILEDDVEIEHGHFPLQCTAPEDVDAIYFGISHGDNNYRAVNLMNGWTKICRVFSTHAILHINPAFSRDVIKEGKNHIYNLNRPFDVGIAYGIQHNYNVYAPKQPVFYQADAKNQGSVNKWERITRTPLNTVKKFSTRTIGV